MDTHSWNYVDSVEDIYNLQIDKNRITFIEPFDRLAEALRRSFELWSDFFQDVLQTSFGLKQELAVLITQIFSVLISMYEIGRLSIVGAETTQLNMTTKTASVTAQYNLTKFMEM